MSGFGSQTMRLAGVLALVLFSASAQAQSQLQNVADDAALAAAQVLGAGGAADEAARAAQETLQETLAASASNTASEVSAAPNGKTITVKVSQPASKTEAVSTVRYVPPDQPATWQWASRQRFVIKASPVVVGSNCVQDCDPVR